MCFTFMSVITLSGIISGSLAFKMYARQCTLIELQGKKRRKKERKVLSFAHEPGGMAADVLLCHTLTDESGGGCMDAV